MQDKNKVHIDVKNLEVKIFQIGTTKSLYVLSSGSSAVLSFSFPFNLPSLRSEKLERVLEVSGVCKSAMG